MYVAEQVLSVIPRDPGSFYLYAVALFVFGFVAVWYTARALQMI